MKRRVLQFMFVAVVVSIVHGFAQFYAWAIAARPMGRWLWRVLSLPAFAITSTDFARANFWSVFIADSTIWGVVAAFFVNHITTQRVTSSSLPQR